MGNKNRCKVDLSAVSTLKVEVPITTELIHEAIDMWDDGEVRSENCPVALGIKRVIKYGEIDVNPTWVSLRGTDGALLLRGELDQEGHRFIQAFDAWIRRASTLETKDAEEIMRWLKYDRHSYSPAVVTPYQWVGMTLSINLINTHGDS